MDIYTANKLLELRKKNNFSQEELAEHLHISRQAISKWERAESSPDTDNLIALAKLYRISLDELLEIDVKTYVRSEIVEEHDSSRKIISLKKESVASDGIEEIFSQRVQDTYNDVNEIYPQKEYGKTSQKADCSSFSSSNYAVPPVQENSTFTSASQTSNVNIVKPYKKKFSRLDFNNIDNSRINFRLLYLFPYYAVAAVFFFLGISRPFSRIDLGYTDLEELSYLWFLTIPLYYTAVAALQKKNMNCFCYPVLAVILFLAALQITGSPASLIMFATIPFYYFYVAVKRSKK